MYKDIATKIAWSYLGKPYLWGGDDPIAGFDCSGFIIEILKSVGMLPKDGDWTAHGLYELFKAKEYDYPAEGHLALWGRTKEHITHVEYCLNYDLSIGASGGGSKTLTERDAIKQNAYIKIRPVKERNPITYVDPFLRG